MVMKHEDLLKKNISNSNCGLNDNFDSSSLSMKLNYVNNSSSISSKEKSLRAPYKTAEYISPYLNGTKLQILSQMIEKKTLQKKSMDITSSFAQACKIYRANSDEFRSNKKKSKKDKTSPLHKFTEPTIPQAVSDMNDSEYLRRVDNNRRYKQKTRRVTKNMCRPNETKTYEFYNGDLVLSPGIKANSDNINKNKANNCKMLKTKKKGKGTDNIQTGDVWSMLRDMNTFQYISSPPISVGSIETIKKKGKIRRNEKETGFIETCTTEEFSYISSYDITSNSQSILSRQSSIDRITIIDKSGDFKARNILDLNPRTVKKKPCKTKRKIKNRQNERQNLIKLPNHFEICNIKNGVNNICTDFQKCLSKETLNGSLNRFDSQATVLNNYDDSIENYTSKDQFIKITPKKQSTFAQCNVILEAIKSRQSNDKLLEASEKSSKAELCLIDTKSFNENNNKVTQVSKFNAGKGNENLSNIRELHKNPRIPIITPKLTKTEIRRRLANLKFPIVILGKDEISSTFQIVHYEFEQFNGLGQQIWLYMTEWLEDLTNKRSIKNSSHNLKSAKSKIELNEKMSNSEDECNMLDKHLEFQNNSNGIKNPKIITETIINPNTNNIKIQKPKVLSQLKNKMLGFISNKNEKSLVAENNFINENINRVSFNRNNVYINPEGNTKERNKHFDAINNQAPNKYPWSKVKWASDFIDNILRKMKKGIYYTQNSEGVKSRLNSEVTTLAETDHIIEDVREEIPEETTDNSIIPGFDDTQYVAPIIVKVKMITRTQISIYHCSTNVVLQFDITIPSRVDTLSSLSLSSFAPVKHENKTKLFKCKTSLANAILPAQLCSIIPKLIAKINETHENLLKTRKKNNDIPEVCGDTTLKLPEAVERLTEGNFNINRPMEVISRRNCTKILSLDSYCYIKNIEILPKIQIRSLWVPMYKRINFLIPKPQKTQCTNKLYLQTPVRNNCMALVPYIPPCKTNILSLSNFKLKLYNDLQKCLTGYMDFIAGVNWGELSNCANYHNIDNTEMSRGTHSGISNIPLNVSITILPIKAISHNENTKTSENKKIKNEKNGYQCVRKYIRKTCKTRKSMTNMVKECCSTPLNKIVNLEDFLQALGCCKQLFSVLQGYSEKKIMTSINEMKCWIKEITPAQALLVLLLTNKKESNYLKRFRPILLQGIAVKRITTASELDMEIEVIEKENLCVSQNEGISLLSTSNGYNFLDELYWIAKTTASDYQKPFDASSKKLLKSLLEKRKKLNPSYLRVMARYVGLGLLKPRKNYT